MRTNPRGQDVAGAGVFSFKFIALPMFAPLTRERRVVPRGLAEALVPNDPERWLDGAGEIG